MILSELKKPSSSSTLEFDASDFAQLNQTDVFEKNNALAAASAAATADKSARSDGKHHESPESEKISYSPLEEPESDPKASSSGNNSQINPEFRKNRLVLLINDF